MYTKFAIRIAVFFLVFIFLVFGVLLWWMQAVSPVDSNDATPVIFVVEKGEDIRSIASRLESQRLIRDSIAFFLTVKLLGIDQDIQAGDFRLNSTMSAKKIAQMLTHGVLDVWITILEGWRIEEIALELARELAIPESEFLTYAKEGYMFPDTYLMPQNATASNAAEMFEDNFYKRFDKYLIAKTKSQGLTIDKVVILASIVEREARFDVDRPIIAGILLKRMQNNWPLEADATVQYALGYQATEKSWWKESLTIDDLEINSSYNTRKFAGLPPGPIGNPGLASLKSVVEPKKTDYWFYLSDTSGKMHYSVTLEEHEANIEKYLR